MRLSKNEAPTPMPYPMSGESGGHEDLAQILGERFGARNGKAKGNPPSRRTVADLLDLVADHRRDLLPTLLAALKDSKPTREHAEQLMDLVVDCGLVESPSPCTTAMTISADLEKLANAAGQWTHPAQVVKHPDAEALYKLCAARIQRESGGERERLVQIQPRLERTARLAQKAASRRSQSAARQPKWVDQWL